MKLAFEVGEQERHEVVFAFDKFWGSLSVSVNGRKVIRDLRLFSVNTTKTYHFDVRESEKHHVRIDKHRKVLGAGFRDQAVKAYADGQLVAESGT